MSETPDRHDGDHDHDANEETKKAEVHNEDVKERHTSHWDTDYMTTEQLEAAYRKGKEKQQAENEDEGEADGTADE